MSDDDGTDERYKDAEWLREHYQEKGETTREIAEECGVSHAWICTWLDRHDIERRDPAFVAGPDGPERPAQEKLPDADRVETLYWEDGLTIDDLAERFDVSDATVWSFMDRHDIDRRETPTAESHPQYIAPEEVLDDLIAGYLTLGCWPSANDYADFGAHACQTVCDKWGSWNAAIEAAQDRYEAEREEWRGAVAAGAADREVVDGAE